MTMSDHQDTEHFMGMRDEAAIIAMLDKAERLKNWHELHAKEPMGDRRMKILHAKNFKALEGVCKTLRWVLGDMDVEHPLE